MSIDDQPRRAEERLLEALARAGADGLCLADLQETAEHLGSDRLGVVLADLERRGRVVQSGERWATLEHSQLRTGLLERTSSVWATVRTQGPGPEGRYWIADRHRAGAATGDRVLLRPSRGRGSGASAAPGPQAKVVRVIDRTRRTIVGRLVRERGQWRLWSWDSRLAVDARELRIASEGAVADTWVEVEVASDRGGSGRGASGRASSGRAESGRGGARGGGARVGRVVEVLGQAGDPGVDGRIALRHHGIPEEFPSDVWSEAAGLRPLDAAEVARRVDLRSQWVVTIDGASARDFDDAISVKAMGRGRLRLWVHVADVAHYVVAGGALDLEALRRGTSVYLPERAVHMLPPALSEGLCSLRPGEDRPAMTVEIDIDSRGKLSGSRVFESVIRSRRRLEYGQVQQVFDQDDSGNAEDTGADLEAEVLDQLRLARRAASALAGRRRRAGTLDFDLPVPELTLDERGEIIEYEGGKRLESHRLIEELMIAANACVATELAARQASGELAATVVYRVHPRPSAENLAPVAGVARSLDLLRPEDSLEAVIESSDGGVGSTALASLLARAAEQGSSRMVSLLLLRALERATYQADCSPHFALALPAYCHFTSPIRRYPDLVVHRRLKGVADGAGSPYGDELAAGLSRLERRAEAAERDVRHWKKIRYLARRVGLEIGGVITGLQEFGVFVVLDDLAVDGLLPVDGLPADDYELDPLGHLLIGRRTRRELRLGDPIRVVVVEVQEERRRLVFGLPQEGATGARGAASESGSGRQRSRGDDRPGRGDDRPSRGEDRGRSSKGAARTRGSRPGTGGRPGAGSRPGTGSRRDKS